MSILFALRLQDRGSNSRTVVIMGDGCRSLASLLTLLKMAGPRSPPGPRDRGEHDTQFNRKTRGLNKDIFPVFSSKSPGILTILYPSYPSVYKAFSFGYF